MAGGSSKIHPMARELKLRIIVESPPPGVDYALQKGSGSAYETDQRQRSAGKDLAFEFTPAIRDGVTDPMAALAGPFVQGPRGGRFVYLDIGACAGQTDSSWSRRLKVPLAGITMKMITAGGWVEACVPGTGRDGGPSCATVKDFDGWRPVKR
jgi:Family of unknown function (DUF5990)